MPGNIRVAVLEAVDLPATITAGNSVAVKVAVGKREFQTTPADAENGRTQPWNSEFLFPVLNLRDNLLVAIMDSKGDVVARAELETPGIVQKGFQDEFIALKAGGRIHMKVSFVLSEEERRKIDSMRMAAMKKRKGLHQPHRSRQALVSNVKITEISSEETGGGLEAPPPQPIVKVDSSDEKTVLTCEKTTANTVEAQNVTEQPSAVVQENVAAPKPDVTLRLEKHEKSRDLPAQQQPSESKTTPGNEEEKITPEELSNSKRKGLRWLSGKLRNDHPKAVDGGKWLEDLNLNNKTDSLRAAKAAKADEWIKRLDKQVSRGDSERKPCLPEDNFKSEGLRLRKHLQEEERKLATLGRTAAEESGQRTVKQKLEDWKLKELGPWRRSSKVRHASPPGDQQSTRWSLKKNRQRSKPEKEQTIVSNDSGVTIEHPELMAAADRLWASSHSEQDGFSPSMSSGSRKKSSGGVKSLMKQVISGAAVVAGSIFVWSRKGSSKKKERNHTVKEGETLSSIVPNEWDDPDSEFYRLNPEVTLDKNVIYPGQLLRLPG